MFAQDVSKRVKAHSLPVYETIDSKDEINSLEMYMDNSVHSTVVKFRTSRLQVNEKSKSRRIVYFTGLPTSIVEEDSSLETPPDYTGTVITLHCEKNPLYYRCELGYLLRLKQISRYITNYSSESSFRGTQGNREDSLKAPLKRLRRTFPD